MKRVVIGGVLTAILYPLVNALNAWTGGIALKANWQLVILSLIAGIITAPCFVRVLVPKLKSEQGASHLFGSLVLTSFVVSALFVLVLMFILGFLVIMGAHLPSFYIQALRALTTVAFVSSFAGMGLVLLLVPDLAVKKPSPVM